MKGLNKKTIVEKYKKAKELYPLRKGGSVIGQEVDNDNRLVYVIKRKDGTTELTLAETQTVIKQIIKREKGGFKKTFKLPRLGEQASEERNQGVKDTP